MQLADFDYELPPELIAQSPAEPRDSARLLVYHRSDRSISHHHVRDLPDLLPATSVLVANDSRVRHARLRMWRTGDGREFELLLLTERDGAWDALVGGKGIHDGDVLAHVADDRLRATVLGRTPSEAMTTFQVRLEVSGHASVEAAVAELGEVPLPPYISGSTADPERYQTVFSRQLGSAAAPTAGLHVTPELIERARARGIPWHLVTLHVGIGTFLPLRNQTVTENHLHREETVISEETALALTNALQEGSLITAIGTTSARTLESHAQDGMMRAGSSSTSLFIYPGYRFLAVRQLLTNFHLPKSSLLMLVAACIGNAPDGSLGMEPSEMIAELHRIYAVAIAERYRFFSFGDAMVIL